jgi:drug/metabolite transporter (DMT)-like permease
VADLALLALTLLWGTTFQLVKAVLLVASPGVFLLARFAFAALALGVAWLATRDRVDRALLRDGARLGLFMLLGFGLQTVGLEHTTPARSAFLTALSVLIVPFLARFALGRPVRAAAWVGVALAVAGLALLTRPFSAEVGAAVRLGDALSAGCAVAFALHITFVSEWSPRHPLVPLVLVQVLVTFLGVALLVPFVVPLQGATLAAGGAGRLAATAAYTGVAMTAGAVLVMSWAQPRTTAVRAALIYALEPVAAALFSQLVGGEALGAADWAGGALVVLGVVAGEVGGALGPRPG